MATKTTLPGIAHESIDHYSGDRLKDWDVIEASVRATTDTLRRIVDDEQADDTDDRDGSKYLQDTLTDGGTDETRAERALKDVVAVEELAPGVCRVVTVSDAHDVDMRNGGCNCEDKQYNLDAGMHCKHEYSAMLYARDDIPGVTMDDNLGGKTLVADGGQVVEENGDDHPAEKYKIVDHDNDDNVVLADTETEARKKKNYAVTECNSDDVEVIPPASESADAESVEPDVIDETADAESVDGPEINAAALAKDPIDWLRSKNADFIYNSNGTPAISKQGFRYLQQQFGITTETEVVETFDDPLGVVVWARAERPNGQFAEAHGEGWYFEDDVEDNEFVRYADTRAKNRAISDLVSAGALAVSELGDVEGQK